MGFMVSSISRIDKSITLDPKAEKQIKYVLYLIAACADVVVSVLLGCDFMTAFKQHDFIFNASNCNLNNTHLKGRRLIMFEILPEAKVTVSQVMLLLLAVIF